MDREKVSQVAKEIRILQEQQADLAFFMALALFKELGIREGSVHEKERFYSAIEEYMR
jgi:hypothetical protein